jgi:hypoxanthine phosphoribosyltransferase
MTWDEFAHSCEELARLIAAEYRPTRLIALTRGGWIPALVLSHLLSVTDVTSISVRYTDEARRHLVAVPPIPSVAQHDRLLLVEDFLLSGKSLGMAANLLRDRASELRTAALGYRSAADIIPDYSLWSRTEAPTFPWELKPIDG